MSKEGGRQGFFASARNFIVEVNGEFRKVVWPSRGSVNSSTKVVLVSTLLFAIFFGVVDFLVLRGFFFLGNF